MLTVADAARAWLHEQKFALDTQAAVRVAEEAKAAAKGALGALVELVSALVDAETMQLEQDAAVSVDERHRDHNEDARRGGLSCGSRH